MASRYATTVYNRRVRVESKIGSIYSNAVAVRSSCDAVSAEILAVWQSPDYLRLPAFERGYVHGLEHGLNADIWRNQVCWRLGPSTGPTRTAIKDAWTAEMSTLCRLPGELYGGHFWLDDDGNPTDKVWTDYKVTN